MLVKPEKGSPLYTDQNTPHNSSADATASGKAEQAELRTLSNTGLRQTLDAHQKWVESRGGEGEKADLRFTDLRGADLSHRVLSLADLQGADLSGANLEEARLDNVNLMDSDLKGAILTGARLENANLQGADFLGREFAGADMAGVKLSEDGRILEPLEVIGEISKNARKTFFVLLLACVYSWLTIATTVDAKLVTDSAKSSLPVIQTQIPIVSFYTVTPFILIVVYVYFHFYLRHLWKAFALLPAIFPDGRRLDDRSYPWLVNAIIRRHFQLLKQDRLLMARLEEFGTILLAWWIVPITLVGFWIRYLPRHEWGGTLLHIGFLTISISLAILFYHSTANIIKANRPKRFNWKSYRSHLNLRLIICVGSAGMFFLLLSYGAINGIRSKDLISADIRVVVPWLFNQLGYDVFADIRETDVSSKPPNFWRIENKQDRIDSVKGAFLKNKDLRYADMFRAFLPKAILRRANFEGARLTKANFEGADMREANFKNASLSMTNLKNTDLRQAKLMNADLIGANLQNANLGLAKLQGADFRDADLQGADLRCANLTGAENLNVKNLGPAKTLYKAKLDSKLSIQIENELPHLLEEPQDKWLELNLRGECE